MTGRDPLYKKIVHFRNSDRKRAANDGVVSWGDITFLNLHFQTKKIMTKKMILIFYIFGFISAFDRFALDDNIERRLKGKEI